MRRVQCWIFLCLYVGFVLGLISVRGSTPAICGSGLLDSSEAESQGFDLFFLDFAKAGVTNQTFDGSRALCGDFGRDGDLSRVDRDLILDLLELIALNEKLNQRAEIWVGINGKSAVEGSSDRNRFSYIHGDNSDEALAYIHDDEDTAHAKGNLYPWGGSQPDDFNGNEDCVNWKVSQTGLIDRTCSVPLGYALCQAPCEPLVKAPTSSPTYSPTTSPSISPSKSPIHSPTRSPSNSPIHSPTRSPTPKPTNHPTLLGETLSPSSHPTKNTALPTISPSVESDPNAANDGTNIFGGKYSVILFVAIALGVLLLVATLIAVKTRYDIKRLNREVKFHDDTLAELISDL